MGSFFIDPEVVRLPPESTRILGLRAKPYLDGFRVRVELDLTPFLIRPLIELALTDQNDIPCGTASLVEPMGWQLELTMHIRSQSNSLSERVPGQYSLLAVLSYPDLGEIDRRSITFDISENG